MKTEKFVADAGDMENAVSRVLKAASSRANGVAILRGIKIEQAEDCLYVMATDMELTLRERVQATKMSGGETVVLEAKKVLAGLKTMSGPLKFEAKQPKGEPNGVLTIQDGKTTLRYSTSEGADFPKIEFVTSPRHLPVPRDALVEAFKGVEHSISTDESRPVLRGMLLEIEDERLRITGTDSYRLTGMSVPLDWPADHFKPVLVDGHQLGKVIRLLAKDEGKPGGHLVFDQQLDDISDLPVNLFVHGQTTTARMRRIDGQFPNWRQLIPDVMPVQVTFDRAEMLDAVARIVTLGLTFSPCRISPAKDGISLSVYDPELRTEAIETTISGTWNADPRDGQFTIGANSGFLKDALTSLPMETVMLRMASPLRPLLFVSPEWRMGTGGLPESYVLLMPIRLPG